MRSSSALSSTRRAPARAFTTRATLPAGAPSRKKPDFPGAHLRLPMLRPDPTAPTDAEPLHGGVHSRPSLPEAVRAQEEALRVLSDAKLARLLDGAARMPVERARQVFVNRNLRMGNVEMVGFDMDYTLAIYHLRRIEQLSFDLTLVAAGDRVRLPGRSWDFSSTITAS